MYIFVFLWTPGLSIYIKVAKSTILGIFLVCFLVLMPSNPPFGMVFACFMVAIMIGSSLYTIILSKGYSAEETLRFVIGLIALTMGICLFTTGPERSQSDIAIR